MKSQKHLFSSVDEEEEKTEIPDVITLTEALQIPDSAYSSNCC